MNLNVSLPLPGGDMPPSELRELTWIVVEPVLVESVDHEPK